MKRSCNLFFICIARGSSEKFFVRRIIINKYKHLLGRLRHKDSLNCCFRTLTNRAVRTTLFRSRSLYVMYVHMYVCTAGLLPLTKMQAIHYRGSALSPHVIEDNPYGHFTRTSLPVTDTLPKSRVKKKN